MSISTGCPLSQPCLTANAYHHRVLRVRHSLLPRLICVPMRTWIYIAHSILQPDCSRDLDSTHSSLRPCPAIFLCRQLRISRCYFCSRCFDGWSHRRALWLNTSTEPRAHSRALMDAVRSAIEFAALQLTLGAGEPSHVNDVLASIRDMPRITFAEASGVLKELQRSPFDAAVRRQIAMALNGKTAVSAQAAAAPPQQTMPAASSAATVAAAGVAARPRPSTSVAPRPSTAPSRAGPADPAAPEVGIDVGDSEFAARPGCSTRTLNQENLFLQRCCGLSIDVCVTSSVCGNTQTGVSLSLRVHTIHHVRKL